MKRHLIIIILLVGSAPSAAACGGTISPRPVNCLDQVWAKQQRPDKQFDIRNDRSGDDAISCATLTSPSAFLQALKDIHSQAQGTPSRSLLESVRFPLVFVDKSGVRRVLSEAQLNEKSTLVFNPDVIIFLQNVRLRDMVVINNKGAMFASGAVWLQAPDVGAIPKIATINHQVLEAERRRISRNRDSD
ncbi:MAG TPA: hypothetical protein VEA77_05315 [Hyphomicrobium sp.]|nr:hypothetical protein [Hyphomicrobium sp.]